ncbi:glutamine amidotransferase, partial [Enterococcus faecium]
MVRASRSVRIGLVLPDVLGTYGDDGNALVLRQRARMRGMSAEVERIGLDDAIPDDCD